MSTSVPVMKLDASEARYNAKPFICSGCPIFPNGIVLSHTARASGLRRTPPPMLVTNAPGAIALTLIRYAELQRYLTDEMRNTCFCSHVRRRDNRNRDRRRIRRGHD